MIQEEPAAGPQPQALGPPCFFSTFYSILHLSVAARRRDPGKGLFGQNPGVPVHRAWPRRGGMQFPTLLTLVGKCDQRRSGGGPSTLGPGWSYLVHLRL